MCGSQKNKTSQTSTYTPTAQASSLYSNVIGNATNTAATPYNPATAQTVAGFTSPQTQAFNAVQGAQGGFQPFLDQAAQFGQQGSGPITSADIARYTSPYQQNVIDTTLASMNHQNNIQQSQLAGNFASQGALGGNRVGVAQGELAKGQNANMAQLIASLNQGGFNTALGAAQTDAQRAQAGAGIFSNLAGQQQGLTYNDIGQLLGTGNQQQQQQQNVNDVASSNASQQTMWPFQTNQWLAGIASALGPLTGSTTTGNGTTTQGKGASGILGGGLTALSLLSDPITKHSQEVIGKTFDGQKIYRYKHHGDPKWRIGLMSDEVKQRRPDAVGNVGGLETVEYGRATDDAASHGRYAAGGPVSFSNMWNDLRPAAPIMPAMPTSAAPAAAGRSMSDYVNLGKSARSGLDNIFRKLDPAGGWGAKVEPTNGGKGTGGLGSLLGFADGGDVDSDPFQLAMLSPDIVRNPKYRPALKDDFIGEVGSSGGGPFDDLIDKYRRKLAIEAQPAAGGAEPFGDIIQNLQGRASFENEPPPAGAPGGTAPHGWGATDWLRHAAAMGSANLTGRGERDQAFAAEPPPFAGGSGPASGFEPNNGWSELAHRARMAGINLTSHGDADQLLGSEPGPVGASGFQQNGGTGIDEPSEVPADDSALASNPDLAVGVPGGSQGVTRFAPEVNDAINEAAADVGIDPHLLAGFADIESSGNPKAKTGSYKGLFQLSKGDFAQHGEGDIFNARDNARAAAIKLKAESADFERTHDRPPEPWELYLIHQQGAGGLASHQSRPDAPAWQNMARTREGREKGEAWAKDAIAGNLPPKVLKAAGGVDNVTSADFMRFWQKNADKKLGASAAAPATTASATSSPDEAPAATEAPASATPDASAAPAGGFNPAAPAGQPGYMGTDTNRAGGLLKKVFGFDFNPLNLSEDERMATLSAGLGMLAHHNVGAGGLEGISQFQNLEKTRRDAQMAAIKLAHEIAPKFGITSVDQAGIPQYGFANSMTETVKPYKTPTSANPTSLADFDEAELAKARNIVAGTEPLPPISRGDKTAYRVGQAVRMMDPTYSAGRHTYMKQWNDPNKNVGMVRAANNTAIAHASELSDLIPSLPDTGVKFLNKAKNWWEGETTDPTLAQYIATANLLADEKVKVATGRAGALADRAEAMKELNPANGRTALNATLKQYTKLFAGKVHALEADYRKNMGPAAPPPDAVSDEARAGLDKLNQRYSPEAPGAAASAPVAITSDAEYEKLPSGTIFTGPDGKKRQKP